MKNSLKFEKKGQITVFIIIGIIVVLSITLFTVLRRGAVEERIMIIEGTDLLQPVYTHVESCIKDSAMPGLYLLGVQGGYIYLPDDYAAAYYSDIGYGYFNGRVVLPSISEIEAQLEQYIADAVPLCVDFSLFPGFEISAEDITADVRVATNEVVFRVSYPIKGRKGESVGEIKDFRIVVPTRLQYVHDVMTAILAKTLEDPDWIDMTYLSGFDVKVDILPHNETVLIYSLTDETRTEPYTFLSAFAFKPNLAPIIDIEDTIYLQDGAPSIREVNVTDPEGDDFTCSDDTALFDITENCIILFTPEVPGRYDVTITAVDARGNRAGKEVEFVVS